MPAVSPVQSTHSFSHRGRSIGRRRGWAWAWLLVAATARACCCWIALSSASRFRGYDDASYYYSTPEGDPVVARSSSSSSMWWQRARQAWGHLNRRTARASERFFRGSDILDDTRSASQPVPRCFFLCSSTSGASIHPSVRPSVTLHTQVQPGRPGEVLLHALLPPRVRRGRDGGEFSSFRTLFSPSVGKS